MDALFAKGLTHDLFLEGGGFLVSVKLIMMAYENAVAIGHLDENLRKKEQNPSCSAETALGMCGTMPFAAAGTTSF